MVGAHPFCALASFLGRCSIMAESASFSEALTPELLESVMQSSRPLVIVAEEVDGEVLATLVINKFRGGLKVAPVKAAGFRDHRKAMLEHVIVPRTAGYETKRSSSSTEGLLAVGPTYSSAVDDSR
jgi:chaperonin GroEL (HSP60 family)